MNFCEKLKEAIADERKGVEEYAKLLEEVKKVAPKEIAIEIPETGTYTYTNIGLFSVIQNIKADEERHAIMLEHIKDRLCE